MSSPRPSPNPSPTPPRGLLLAAGLVLGVIGGMAGAALLGSGGGPRETVAEAKAAAAARSQLGGGVANSAFTRKHESLLAGIKAGHAEVARKLSPQGRLQLLL